MDFWDGESDEEVEELNNVFTVGKTSKLNLEPAIAKGYGHVIYSSCKEVREFQVDTYSHSGWEVSHSHASG